MRHLQRILGLGERGADIDADVPAPLSREARKSESRKLDAVAGGSGSRHGNRQRVFGPHDRCPGNEATADRTAAPRRCDRPVTVTCRPQDVVRRNKAAGLPCRLTARDPLPARRARLRIPGELRAKAAGGAASCKLRPPAPHLAQTSITATDRDRDSRRPHPDGRSPAPSHATLFHP